MEKHFLNQPTANKNSSTASIINEDNIASLIYRIRGQDVMLDSDLALLYECTNGTKTINQAVKRNIERFPEDFCFQLTKDEYMHLKSQFGTSKTSDHGGVRKLPFVFTEQGVAMLATVIKTPIASTMSVAIMRAFVVMRRYISDNLIKQKYVNEIVFEDHDRINLLEESLKNLEKTKKDHEIYFEGQVYDAYSKIHEILNRAKTNIIIIDSYADITLLNIIKKLKINTLIVTKKNNLLTHQDIHKYNQQYHNLTVAFSNDFHDRYLILDQRTVYHCGASINRIGHKVFSITKVNDPDVLQLLLKKINDVNESQ